MAPKKAQQASQQQQGAKRDRQALEGPSLPDPEELQPSAPPACGLRIGGKRFKGGGRSRQKAWVRKQFCPCTMIVDGQEVQGMACKHCNTQLSGTNV